MATAPVDSGSPNATRNGEPVASAADPPTPPRGGADGHPATHGWALYVDQLLGVLLDRASVLTGFVTHALGAALVTLATTGIGYIVWLYFALVSPYWFTPLSAPWFALTAVGVWLLVMILFSYFATIMTSPGLAPEAPSRDLRVRAEALTPPALVEAHEPGALDPRSGGEFSTEDRRTGRWKPPRSHYDHVSGKVVLRFDHYCPWVWNAIGHFNYRYFIGFLVYMFAGCIYFAVLAFPLFQAKDLPESIPPGWRVHVNVGLVLPLSVSLAVGLFALWHGFLAATNQTTIEFFHNLSRAARARERGYASANFYDLGIARNLREVFGTGHVCLLLAPVLRAPPGNGIEWATRIRPSIEYSRLGRDGTWHVPKDLGAAEARGSARPASTVSVGGGGGGGAVATRRRPVAADGASAV
ncbi:hypothetical protein FNF27_06359 [Cafeteria roenbergensis]|uniref:Palmitoyltransferase n=2 Tax=Cafeteria roenbergensis TaxID=33653 RepID=A0A5A8E580_CAFRO|nr:hypothetical protein FNF27_06359 [Cafeteria roenbergensis]